MWTLKLRLDSSKQFLGKLAIKHKVSMTGYPLSYYKDKKWLYNISAGFLFGPDQNVKSLLKDLKKQPELVKLESKDDFFIIIIKAPLFTEPVHNPKIFRPGPTIINRSGFHIWDLASFDRKPLEKVLKMAEKKFDAKILKFREEKLANIAIAKANPNLTKNQKKAMELAINSGYYEYPKKAKLEDLSKKMKISYSTFQAHLKKAEGKLIPEVFKEL